MNLLDPVPYAWTLGRVHAGLRAGGVDEGTAVVRRTFAMVAGAAVLLTGCSGSGGGSEAGPASSSAASSSSAPPAEPPAVSLSLTDGATDVAPSAPLEISVEDGELAEVSVVSADGTAVPGAVEDGTGGAPSVWTADESLAYSTSYTLTATATGEGDAQAEATATFTTVTPEDLFTPAIGPLDGTVVGVGMPIRVYFDEPVPEDNRAEVERNLEVTSSKPTDGVWSWLTDTEVHFRPSEYWPADTDVTLDADLYGVEVAEGVWGEVDRSISFSIGERHVSVADAGTFTMKVYDGDRLVQNFPMSAGGPEFPSRNGPHVVTELNAARVMDSSTYGVPVDSPNGYRTPVKHAVRLSNNGEFVHGAPWSVAQQGNANVSHGCINLSPERAEWFFTFSQPGDVVEIVNSQGPTLSPADGDIYDWAIPWDEWRAGSALT